MPNSSTIPQDVQDALDYMGIDYADAKVIANVTRALAAAKALLRGAVGDDVETYLPNDPRIVQLVHIYTDDLYSDRGVSIKVSGATRRLVQDLEIQLRMELLRAKEAAT